MTNRVIADRYAQALVGMISDINQLDRIDEEIQFICDLLNSDINFKRFYFSPRILPEVKKNLFQKVFQDKISIDLLNLFFLIIDKHREKITPELARSFSKYADEIRGVESGIVVSAVPLLKSEIELLEKAIRKFSNRQITLQFEVDPKLLGGIVLRLGDHVIDGSVRFKLETIRKKLFEVKTYIPSDFEVKN